MIIERVSAYKFQTNTFSTLKQFCRRANVVLDKQELKLVRNLCSRAEHRPIIRRQRKQFSASTIKRTMRALGFLEEFTFEVKSNGRWASLGEK